MQLSVESKVSAPIAEVWDAYVSPNDIKQWNAASDDWHTTHASVDLREGGHFSSRMEAKDGSFGFDFEGTYTKIVPQQRIDYVFGNRKGSVAFIQDGKDVRVRSTFDVEKENSVEQQREGWQSILDRFARHVEAGRPQD